MNYDEWNIHQMDVHNISCEFYHPSAARIAHMSRYVTYQSIPQPANTALIGQASNLAAMGSGGFRFGSGRGELYTPSTWGPRPSVLPPDMMGGSSMARMTYTNPVVPGTISTVAMDLSGRGQFPSCEVPLPGIASFVPAGPFVPKTCPQLSPPKTWCQEPGVNQVLGDAIPLVNQVPGGAEGLLPAFPLKSSTPVPGSKDEASSLWEVEVSADVRKGKAMRTDVGHPPSMTTMELPAPLPPPGLPPVPSLSAEGRSQNQKTWEAVQGIPGDRSGQVASMDPIGATGRSVLSALPQGNVENEAPSARGRRLEETKKRAKDSYFKRKTLTVRMEAVEGKLLELEQRMEGCEEMAEQLRAMLNLSLE